MTPERSLETRILEIIFYLVGVVIKGITAYFTYLGVYTLTNNHLGAVYLAVSVFATLMCFGLMLDNIRVTEIVVGGEEE